MRAGAEYGRGRTGQAVGGSAAARQLGSRRGYFSPRALASSSRLIPDRPGRSRCWASSYSSTRVLREFALARVRAAPVLGAAARVLGAAAAALGDAAILGVAARLLDAAVVFGAAARVLGDAAVLGAAARVLDAAAVVLGDAAVLGAAARLLDAAAVLGDAAPVRVRRATVVTCRPTAVTAFSGSWGTVCRAAVACSAFLPAFFCLVFATVSRFRGSCPPARCPHGRGKEAEERV